MRNKIKHRKKYKIGKSPTPLGKINQVEVEDYNQVEVEDYNRSLTRQAS